MHHSPSKAAQTLIAEHGRQKALSIARGMRDSAPKTAERKQWALITQAIEGKKDKTRRSARNQTSLLPSWSKPKKERNRRAAKAKKIENKKPFKLNIFAPESTTRVSKSGRKYRKTASGWKEVR